MGKYIDMLMEAEAANYLFHGSQSRLRRLTPRKSHLSEEPVVFAGLLWAALSFIPRWDDRDIWHGTINGVPTIKRKRKSPMDIFDTGGYLHLVRKDTFIQTENLTKFEYISYDQVEVEQIVRVENVLSVLRELGVDIHT